MMGVASRAVAENKRPGAPARRSPALWILLGVLVIALVAATWSYEVSSTVIPANGLGSFALGDYMSIFGQEEAQSRTSHHQQEMEGEVEVMGTQLKHTDKHHSSSHHHHHKDSHGKPGQGPKKNLTQHWSGMLSLIIFVAGYFFVICEDRFQPFFRKSVPMTIAAGLIWAIVSLALDGGNGAVAAAARHNLLEFGEVFLFLLVAMTYIATMEELNVFNVLRVYLVDKQFSYRMMFWITGGLAFVLSPLADNLTTALLMGAVLTNIGREQEQFVALGCINVVVAANAGGAFSPFGDITTLMMWQRGKLHIFQFFSLIIPSIVNWAVPASIMVLYVPKGTPSRITGEHIVLAPGGLAVVMLFLLTISMTASFHSTFHLPPVLGMMTGLGFLQAFGFFALRSRKGFYAGIKDDDTPEWTDEGSVKKSGKEPTKRASDGVNADEEKGNIHGEKPSDRLHPLNIFRQLEKAEWDTLLFFYGVVMCVGALGLIGYLDGISRLAYEDLGPTAANVLVGALSAIVDNIPVMYAVLSTDPTMSTNQWLLVTLTAGVGGSILSVGSAAGVGLMGQARGIYTFKEHLRWSWVVLLGYGASILTHLVVNGW